MNLCCSERSTFLSVPIRRSFRSHPISNTDWQSAPSFTYAILDRVHCNIKESPTQWRIVYDPRRLEIHFLTLENPQRRTVRFRDFSLNCTDKAAVLDLQSAGDVGKNFVAYSSIVNDELVHKTFTIYKQAGFQKDMPDIYMAVLAAYPNMLKCQ